MLNQLFNASCLVLEAYANAKSRDFSKMFYNLNYKLFLKT